MILQALYDYYQRLLQESEGMVPEGFENKEIPFIIILDREGEFKGIQDTREGEGKKKFARIFVVPRATKRTVGIAANLLWDNPAYVLGCPKPDKNKDYKELKERAKDQHAAFITCIRNNFPDTKNEGISAVLNFIEKGDYSQLFEHSAWKEIEESGSNLSFKLEGENNLVCQHPDVMIAISSSNNEGSKMLRQCLVTGNLDEPAILHASIKGVWGAQTSGANIVSFNRDAFKSLAKEQGQNAPVGKKAEFAYTTALNTLLSKGSRQRIQVGDSSTVFWAGKRHPMEDWFADFFGENTKTESTQDNEAIKALYNAPHTGAPPLMDDSTPFFVLGLSPNASRIAIRFWYNGSVSDVANHIRQHFEDTALIHSPKESDHLSLFRLLVSISLRGKSDNIQPNLAGDIMKSILNGTPYPQTLLSAAICRVRAEHEINYPRAALIKAVLCRESRFYRKTDKEVGMSLDINNTNPGYRLGRLFAVLERAQELANPNINATIRDRFYGAASGTPVAAFPQLLKLKTHHIAKLDNKGLAINLEKQIEEIMGGLGDFPAHLSLADQGRFAIGYYHQRQAFFTKVNN